MTPAEQALADDKMRAEIAWLIEETARINRQPLWLPFAAGAGFVLGVAGITGFVLKALSGS